MVLQGFIQRIFDEMEVTRHDEDADDNEGGGVSQPAKSIIENKLLVQDIPTLVEVQLDSKGLPYIQIYLLLGNAPKGPSIQQNLAESFPCSVQKGIKPLWLSNQFYWQKSPQGCQNNHRLEDLQEKCQNGKPLFCNDWDTDDSKYLIL